MHIFGKVNACYFWLITKLRKKSQNNLKYHFELNNPTNTPGFLFFYFLYLVNINLINIGMANWHVCAVSPSRTHEVQGSCGSNFLLRVSRYAWPKKNSCTYFPFFRAKSFLCALFFFFSCCKLRFENFFQLRFENFQVQN